MPNRIIRDALLDSEKYDALPLEARLAFFEILLRADDYGLIPLAHLWLRRHCPTFDGRSADFADGILSGLADQDLIRVYTVDSKRFAFIPQFGNRPQAIAPKYPTPPESLTRGAIEEAQRQAKNLPRTLKRQLERNQALAGFEPCSNPVPTLLESPETETETETETEKKNLNNMCDVATAPLALAAPAEVKAKAATPPDCPFDEILAAYREILPTCRGVVDLNQTRRDHIRARWRQVWADERFDTPAGIAFFRRFFGLVAASRFLTGRVVATPGRKPFLASLPWLMNAENFLKVLEGNYA